MKFLAEMVICWKGIGIYTHVSGDTCISVNKIIIIKIPCSKIILENLGYYGWKRWYERTCKCIIKNVERFISWEIW